MSTITRTVNSLNHQIEWAQNELKRLRTSETYVIAVQGEFNSLLTRDRNREATDIMSYHFGGSAMTAIRYTKTHGEHTLRNVQLRYNAITLELVSDTQLAHRILGLALI
ncbi:hypothetical protein ACWX0P_30780 [Vibrio mediterranei]